MVAFSGEVKFHIDDANCESLLGEKFTESNMNPGLKGRDMRKAFDTTECHVMIVAQKFQTGFDQPKLCAMYVDKKLGGLECVQILSRLNRTLPGKEDTYSRTSMPKKKFAVLPQQRLYASRVLA